MGHVDVNRSIYGSILLNVHEMNFVRVVIVLVVVPCFFHQIVEVYNIERVASSQYHF